mgnify:CR=1 FL=1
MATGGLGMGDPDKNNPQKLLLQLVRHILDKKSGKGQSKKGFYAGFITCSSDYPSMQAQANNR